MQSENSDIGNTLFKKLEQKGIEKNQIPLFIKDLINTFSAKDISDLMQINNCLHVLGWADFELDYHTLQLAKAYIDYR